MLTATKIRLVPTVEQERLFWQSVGTSRWAYNYFLSENKKVYEETKCYLSEMDVRKQITKLKATEEYAWLKTVGSNVVKQAVKDANNALKRFFAGMSGYPKYKLKHRSKPSFYVNYESLVRKQGGFQGERLGFVRTTHELPVLMEGKHYSNPRISYDGKYWYLSVGYEVPDIHVELTDTILGIDLGIKDLAVCSDGKVYKNINKTKRVKQLKKKLKRAQRKLSRRMEANIKYRTENNKPIYKRPLRDCKNIQKAQAEVRSYHKKLKDIRTNYLHQTTTEIVKTKPSRIVMEDLNVKGLMKNKHLAGAIQEQGWSEFVRQIQYKCERYGIEFVQADRFYASSKMCSHCGNVNRDLKLSDRTYVCPVCGVVIDRDMNAALNLTRYKLA